MTHPKRNYQTLDLLWLGPTRHWHKKTIHWHQQSFKKTQHSQMIEDINIPPKKIPNRTKSQLILNMIAVTSWYCISPSHNMACDQNGSKGATCCLDLLHISQLIFHTRIPRFWGFGSNLLTGILSAATFACTFIRCELYGPKYIYIYIYR